MVVVVVVVMLAVPHRGGFVRCVFRNRSRAHAIRRAPNHQGFLRLAPRQLGCEGVARGPAAIAAATVLLRGGIVVGSASALAFILLVALVSVIIIIAFVERQLR